jgi:hypothetical protein
MLNSTASYGAPESTHYDFSHSLRELCKKIRVLIEKGFSIA